MRSMSLFWMIETLVCLFVFVGNGLSDGVLWIFPALMCTKAISFPTQTIIISSQNTRPHSLPTKQPPLPHLKRRHHPLPPTHRPLQKRSIPPVLQIHTPLLKLPFDVRHVDGNEDVRLLLHQAHEREQDNHEFRLVGPALLFGSRRRGREEVVSGRVGTETGKSLSF